MNPVDGTAMTTPPDGIMIEIGAIVCRRGTGLLVSYALGSCIGVAMHDPVAKVGGMLHVQLPSSTTALSTALSQGDPGRYVDTGMPRLRDGMLELGATAGRIRTVLAGGAVMKAGHDFFGIASRNLVAVRKWLWSSRILVAAEDTGGNEPRNMRLDILTGNVLISKNGITRTLFYGSAP
jgi:chemotaxis protein CheD